MDFSKIKKISFILLILFILLFPFWCVRGLCAETEEVPVTNIYGLQITESGNNYFVANESQIIAYFPVEKGYIYHLNYSYTESVPVVSCDEVPTANLPFDRLYTLTAENNQYDFIASNNDTNIIISYRRSSYVTVTREKIPGMDSTINDLVENVGINSIWNIFDISINYIVVVVLFAFGCYIIFRIIRKISRGKEGL